MSVPKIFKLCLTGEAIWESLDGSYSFNPSYPAGLSDAQGDAVAALLDELRDWLDVAGELSYKEKRQAVKSLTEHTKQLGEVGLFVGVRDRHFLLIGGSVEPTPWRGFDIEFQSASEAQFADADGNPLAARA
jgi:hypothetical protein